MICVVAGVAPLFRGGVGGGRLSEALSCVPVRGFYVRRCYLLRFPPPFLRELHSVVLLAFIHSSSKQYRFRV